MLIEAYGVEGAFRLGQRLNVDQIDLLLKQTYNLRRDPKEIEKENAEEALDNWIQENQGTTLTLQDETGKPIEVDISAYLFN